MEEEVQREEIMTMNRISLASLSVAGLIFAGGLALSEGQYGPGVSDTEIKIEYHALQWPGFALRHHR